MNKKPTATLSLDLDNQWSYMKTHGNPAWSSLPSYLDVVVPRFLELLDRHAMKITVFVVGQDAAQPENRAVLRSIAQAGHEIGNHSYHHEPWLHLYSPTKLEEEIGSAERVIEEATGVRPVGFRGPGYSLSATVLTTLVRRGYLYDASTLPTFIGPLARAYYFMSARLTAEQREERKKLFGTFRDGFRPLKPYTWIVDERRLLEIPVTTMPGARIPIHLSYVLYASMYSRPGALAYLRSALLMCRIAGVEPSLLLHPLDLIGQGEAPPLEFFPAMRVSAREKLSLLDRAFKIIRDVYAVMPLDQQARHILDNRRAATPELRWRPN